MQQGTFCIDCLPHIFLLAFFVFQKKKTLALCLIRQYLIFRVLSPSDAGKMSTGRKEMERGERERLQKEEGREEERWRKGEGDVWMERRRKGGRKRE